MRQRQVAHGLGQVFLDHVSGYPQVLGNLLVAQSVVILQDHRRTSLGRELPSTSRNRSIRRLRYRSEHRNPATRRALAATRRASISALSDLAAIGDGVLLDQIARDCKQIGLRIEDRIRIADA